MTKPSTFQLIFTLQFVVVAVTVTTLLALKLANGLSTTSSISDQEIKQLSAELLKLDKNKASVVYHLQGKQRSNSPQSYDLASEPLFEKISDDILKRPSYAKFIKLLDNYERKVEDPEAVTDEEKNEMNDFLNHVTNTDVMKKVKQFLVDKGQLRSNDNFQEKLFNIWFKLYSRNSGKTEGSSGFEHVFVGEVKHKEISGLHNWLRFYLLEQSGAVDYEGFFVHLMLESPVTFLKYKLSWDKFTKPTSSMFVGTSPEFEMALYTLCFYSRPNKKCHITLGKKTLGIQTYTLNYHGETYIGSAYPTL